MPYLPITPFFPLLGLLGALPLPDEVVHPLRPAVRLPAGERESDYLQARNEAMRVRRRLQAMVTRLKNRRRSVFFG